MQRFAGAVKTYHSVVSVDVQIQPNHRFVYIHTWPPAAVGDELITNGVLGFQRGISGMGDRRIADVAIDCKSVLWRQILRPVDAVDGLIQLIGR